MERQSIALFIRTEAAGINTRHLPSGSIAQLPSGLEIRRLGRWLIVSSPTVDVNRGWRQKRWSLFERFLNNE